jgi:hypothetical protein
MGKGLRVSLTMRLFAIPCVLLSLQAQFSTQPAGELSTVSLTFLTCTGSADRANNLRLYVLDTTNRRHVENQVHYNLKKTMLGVEAEIRIAPGFYNLGLIGPNCRDETLLPVLRGRDQDALLIGWKGMTLKESSAMIAGTAPFQGYTASIAYYPQDQNGSGPKSLVVIPARVEGDSYYATGVPTGTARLRIYTTDRTGWLEFKVGTLSSTNRNVVFNVSDADVRAAMSHRM